VRHGAQFAQEDHAFVTLLTNDSFFPGVVTLCKSISASGSKYPVYVMVSSEVSETTKQRLLPICPRLLVVDRIECPYPSPPEHDAPWVSSDLTKLHIWNLTQFKKVVYLDADTIVVGNIDEVRLRTVTLWNPVLE
jgi:alpha-N-acetylglucosamine transferase